MRKRKHSIRGGIGIFLALGLVAAACGDDTDEASGGATDATDAPEGREAPTASVTVLLDFFVYGGHAPILLALERGYFEEEGLQVGVQPGTGSVVTVTTVGAGTYPMGLASSGPMISGIGEGIPVKAIAGHIQESPQCVIVRTDSGIEELSDLEGRSVGIASGTSDQFLFPGLMEINGVDVDAIEEVGLTFQNLDSTFILDQVDSIVGFVNGNLQRIIAEGVDAECLPFAENGLNVPGTQLIVNTEWLEENRETAERFVAAYQRGLQDTLDDPEAAVDAVLTFGPETLDRSAEFASLEATIPLFHTPNTEGEPLGCMSEADWEAAVGFIEEYEGLENPPQTDDVYTNEFVPSC